MRKKEGAEIYAEQILTDIETGLNKLQQVVKSNQVYLEQQRATAGSASSYYDSNKTPDYAMK